MAKNQFVIKYNGKVYDVKLESQLWFFRAKAHPEAGWTCAEDEFAMTIGNAVASKFTKDGEMFVRVLHWQRTGDKERCIAHISANSMRTAMAAGGAPVDDAACTYTEKKVKGGIEGLCIRRHFASGVADAVWRGQLASLDHTPFDKSDLEESSEEKKRRLIRQAAAAKEAERQAKAQAKDAAKRPVHRESVPSVVKPVESSKNPPSGVTEPKKEKLERKRFKPEKEKLVRKRLSK